MSRVLVVEDEQWMADCYKLWLEADGHTVTHSSDAQEAIDSIDEHKPEVVLVDLFLPLANGLQLLQMLRSHADLQHIPVILSSSALPETMPDMSAYGVYEVLNKADIGPSDLQRVVQGALRRAAV